MPEQHQWMGGDVVDSVLASVGGSGVVGPNREHSLGEKARVDQVPGRVERKADDDGEWGVHETLRVAWQILA